MKCASLGRRHRAAIVATVVFGAATQAGAAPPTTDEPRSLPAAFQERSYAPGDRARLVLWRRTPRVTVRLYRVGPERQRTRANDVLLGVPVGSARTVLWRRTLSVSIPAGPSGLYFARLSAPSLRDSRAR